MSDELVPLDYLPVCARCGGSGMEPAQMIGYPGRSDPKHKIEHCRLCRGSGYPYFSEEHQRD